MSDTPATSRAADELPPDRGEAIFHGALQLPEAQRADYVTQACGGDAQLRQQVEALLKAHAAAGGFLEEPQPPSPNKTIALTLPLTEKPGDRIGRYKLLQQIGEGGCGVVYMAEQEQPVRRRVALKVIKLGMDTRQVVARFEAERQALALMDHPNIAKVLDAGATDTGRPFFVMELVRGILDELFLFAHLLEIHFGVKVKARPLGATRTDGQFAFKSRKRQRTAALQNLADTEARAKTRQRLGVRLSSAAFSRVCLACPSQSVAPAPIATSTDKDLTAR